ncbi:MAG: MFS transporter [Oscillospiraceae bacterium]|nr:MFS transporter [Oscillospiraceae bacterium]
MKLSSSAKKAFLLGGLCSVSYLAVYVAKGALSAATPQITAAGAFTTEQIGTLSSVYFIVYAIGQLINGFIGDKIKAKYMISFGLILSSIGFLLLPQLAGLPNYAYIAYGSCGFFMAMIYGPMTKVVAENVEPLYATRCSIGYTMASFLGSPAAGILAAVLAWQWVFRSTGSMLLIMGLVAFICFTLLEKKGIVKYGQYKPKKGASGNVKVLIKRQIIKFTFIALITGVVRTTVVFWMPTYISQHLGFQPDTAALIFTVASFAFSFSAINAIVIYEKLKRNMDLTILLAFIAATVFFLLVFVVQQPIINVVCMSLAILSNNLASSMMWSRYCPSLYDTGMVSTATGFLDACSYLAASVSSKLFANAAGTIGWGPLILVWGGLMALGILVSLPWNKLKKQEATA